MSRLLFLVRKYHSLYFYVTKTQHDLIITRLHVVYNLNSFMGFFLNPKNGQFMLEFSDLLSLSSQSQFFLFLSCSSTRQTPTFVTVHHWFRPFRPLRRTARPPRCSSSSGLLISTQKRRLTAPKIA